MSIETDELRRRRAILKEVMDAVLSGNAGSISRHFAPGAVISNRNNAGLIDGPWFDRMEGEFRLNGEEEAKSFLSELMRRTAFISYDARGTVIEDDDAACRCDWTRQDERDGSLVTGTTMYWFGFTSDGRIRSIESIGAVHSVIPARRFEVPRGDFGGMNSTDTPRPGGQTDLERLDNADRYAPVA